MVSYKHFLNSKECSEILEQGNKEPFSLNSTDNRKVYVQKFNIPDWFKLKLKSIGIFYPLETYLNKYEKGCYFNRHVDRYNFHTERFKTLIIKLNKDYTGGKFLLDDQQELLDLGDMVIFNSDVYHELQQILSGTRYSLVCWLAKESFINKNVVI